MERLDQGNFHPQLEHPRRTVSRQGLEPTTSCTACGHSSKELFEQLINCYSEPLHNLLLLSIRNPYSTISRHKNYLKFNTGTYNSTVEI